MPPDPGAAETMRYLVTTFVDAVRDSLKDAGFARKEKDQEEGGVFLVGYRGPLYCVQSDYQVAESADGYAAVGHGAQTALGALYASPPRERARITLEAAEYHNGGVRGPFVIDVLADDVVSS